MRLISLAVLLALALPASAAMYKWVDAQGRVQYSDTPPPPGTKVEEQRIIRNTIATGGTPFAVQEAAKRNPVTLWMHDCGDLCNRARDFLASRGIPYTLRNPSRMGEQDAWKKASAGENAVPLLVVGTRTVKGFEEPEWNVALDAAGYPRGAPALKPQAIPPATDPVPPAKPAPVAPPADQPVMQEIVEAAPPAQQQHRGRR
jgi:glutaredoxin